MPDEVRYQIEDLSELEYHLIINALKVWRGDFGTETNGTTIWGSQLDRLLTRLGFGEKGWQKKDA